MTNFKIFLFIFINFTVTFAQISDKRLCANPECSEVVSLARTVIRYNSNDHRILSFPPNTEIKIYSKSAGSRSDLWGAEINGRRGYVPASMVRETKILYKQKLQHLVPTEGQEDVSNNSASTVENPTPSSTPMAEAKPADSEVPIKEQIAPNTVSQPYEVIDGTTIFMNPASDGSSDFYSTTPSNEANADVSHSETVSTESIAEPTLSVTPDPNLVADNINAAKNQELNEQKDEQIKSEANEDGLIKNQENLVGINDDTENVGSKSVFDKLASLWPDDDADDAEVDDEDEYVDDEEDENEDEEEEEKDNTLNKIVSSENMKNISYDNVEEILQQVPETVQVDAQNVDADIDSNNSNNNIIENETKTTDSTIASSESTEELKEPVDDLKVEVANNESDIKPVTEPNSKDTEDIISVQDLKESDSTIQPIVKDSDSIVVPSDIQSPLKLFRSASAEIVDNANIDNSQSQVPENLSSSPTNNPATLTQPDTNVQEQFVPTTESTIVEVPLPYDLVADVTTTENPVLVNNHNPEHIETFANIENVSTVENLNVANEPLEPIIETLQTEKSGDDAVVNANYEEMVPPTQIPFYPNVVAENLNSIEVNNVKEEIENKDPDNIKEAQNVSSFIDNPTSALEEINIETSTVKDQIVETNFINNVNEAVPEITLPDDNVMAANLINNPDEVVLPTVQEEQVDSKTNEDVQESTVDPASDQLQEEEPGLFSRMYSSIFGPSEESNDVNQEQGKNNIEETTEKIKSEHEFKSAYDAMWSATHAQEKPVDKYLPPSGEQAAAESTPAAMQSCDFSQNPSGCQEHHSYISNEEIVNNEADNWKVELPENTYSIFLYLTLTATTLLLFSLGYYYIEKKRKDGTLIASINDLEKKLLVSTKECLILQDDLKITKERLSSIEDSSFGSNEMVTALKDELEEAGNVRSELEEQIANLEKELESATEAGMEMNRMLQEILSSQPGNEHLMQNVEHLQKQLNEQQVTINTMNSTLNAKNTENELLQTELSVSNERIIQLQAELDKMVVNLLSVQEEKSKNESELEEQNQKITTSFEKTIKDINSELNVLKEDNKKLKSVIEDTQRSLDLKTNEYTLLKEGMIDVQASQSNKESLKALLDVSKVKAEVQQLREEKHKNSEMLQKEREAKMVFEKEVQVMIQEVQILKDKFDEAEREKVEAQTRLEVLSTYFKEKEAQLQKEINENESKWMQKEGEATSTIERIKWIQEELQNYKSQNELLKKEILDQEVSLKSQISMLEKKSHDHWLLARQAERRVEESKQEASQLRNRLTIVEKNLSNNSQVADESKLQNRIMSPLESNGELPVSPMHMGNVENPGSPPLLFPHRDHMTTSPPIPGLPPFMPPPPGVPFMPPPMPGVPPFMPPPPALFPGDHRPPPLGRMSSPPLHGRYSPDSRAYSPYDRDDSPPLSPTYTDNEYRRRSPPPPPSSHMPRNYSPYHGKGRPPHWDEDRDYRGHMHRNKPRPHKGPGLSSGSGNSNESLDNSGRHSGRV